MLELEKRGIADIDMLYSAKMNTEVVCVSRAWKDSKSVAWNARCTNSVGHLQ